MNRNLSTTRMLALGLAAAAILTTGCGGGSGPESVAGTASDGNIDIGDLDSGDGEGPDLSDVDLSVDLDELDRLEEERLAAIDIDAGFQCPTIANRTVDELTTEQVARVEQGADGCVFYFSFFESDPLEVDTYTKDIFVSEAQASADLLAASNGGRPVDVPNALAAYVFESGFMPDNLPEPPSDGSLGDGRQVIGYFMSPLGIRLIAVFPDAIVGFGAGSDAVRDKAERAELFVTLAKNTSYALS